MLVQTAKDVGESTILGRAGGAPTLAVGLPDCDTYLSHMARTHQDQEAMGCEAFFRERLEARYGGGDSTVPCRIRTMPGKLPAPRW